MPLSHELAHMVFGQFFLVLLCYNRFTHCYITVNFLNIRTPKKFVVITLKVEQDVVSLE